MVVCTGYQLKSFAPLSHSPLTPVRGQITMLPTTSHSENLRTIVSAHGNLAPSAGELHVLGATHGFNDEAMDLRASDHAENLSRKAYTGCIETAMSGLLPQAFWYDLQLFDERLLGGKYG